MRNAAKDWETFNSDVPFRVAISSWEDVRTMRQLPIETNPHEHERNRALVATFFHRAKEPATIARVGLADLPRYVFHRPAWDSRLCPQATYRVQGAAPKL